MHIEKNVCDAIVGALLNISGKTKDGLKARKDMTAMSQIELAPQERGQRIYLSPTCYTLSKVEKTSFCGMKFHDRHVLMQ